MDSRLIWNKEVDYLVYLTSVTQSEKNLENVEYVWEMEINGIKGRVHRLSEKSLIYLGENNYKLLQMQTDLICWDFR